jgi:hypothetical protein
MAKKAEFEEPEYEGPLYNQLSNGSLNLWTPGRRFERIFGIDAALISNNQYFWNLFAQSSPNVGTSLRNYEWHFLWHLIKRHFRPVPSFNVNVLIQSKRPEHRSGVNSKYSINGIKGAYWQFQITNHQQKILEKLEAKLSSDALVVYACPAFHKFDDLDRYIASGQIIENSTFVKASALTNHKKWVYDSAGTTGIACSEIKKHSDVSFEKMVSNLRERVEQSKNKNINFKPLNKIVNEICLEEENNPLVKAYKRRNKNLREYFYSIRREVDYDLNNKEYENFIDFMSFAQFASTINTEWFTL